MGARSTANAEAADWRVSEDVARTAAEHIALSPETEAQREHNRAGADTQRVFAGWQRLRSLTPLPGRDGQPFVYVANYAYGGWALIAADAHMPPLLGFSEHGSFAVKELTADGNLAVTLARNREHPTLPEGMLDWLETTYDVVAALRENPDAKNAAPGSRSAWIMMVTKPIAITELPDGGGSGQGWRLPGGGTGGGGGVVDGDDLWPPAGGGSGGSGGGGGGSPCSTTQRGPYLRTNWGQGCGYNDFCPAGNGANYCGHSPTGCVATAMAQVLYFHRYPNNFNWAAMPVGGALAAGTSPDIAMLMFMCGRAVSMSYGNTESGAWDRLVAPALTGGPFLPLGILSFYSPFRYSSADYVNGNSVNPGINNDLDAGRPSIVGGESSSSGHLWVCDGYISSVCTSTVNANGNAVTVTSGWRNYHMNWGWNGSHTGWFDANDWRVTVSNGDVRNYQYNHCAIVNIHP